MPASLTLRPLRRTSASCHLRQFGRVEISIRYRLICLQSDLIALYVSVIIVSEPRFRGSLADKVVEGACEAIVRVTNGVLVCDICGLARPPVAGQDVANRAGIDCDAESLRSCHHIPIELHVRTVVEQRMNVL